MPVKIDETSEMISCCKYFIELVLVVFVLWPVFRCFTQAVAKQDVVMQIIMHAQSSSENKYQTAHVKTKEQIMHAREIFYTNLRQQFTINSWLNFTKTETPYEILSIYCKEIFYRNVNTLFLHHGSDSISSSSYILELAHNLGYPVISWDPHYPGALQSNENSRVLQIAPTIHHQCQALQILLNRYNWTDFAIITTKITSNVDFLNCMNDMVERTRTKQGFTITATYKILVSVIIDIDDFSKNKDAVIKDALMKVVRSVARVIILHAGEQEALDIMDIAREIVLTGSKYMWLLTSSSIGALAKYTKFPVGILGIMYNDSQIMIEQAIETAVKIWALGLEEIAKNPHQLKRIKMYPSNTCNTSKHEYWSDGDVLYKAMRNVVMTDPPVSFSRNGIIENVELKIYNVRPSKDLSKKYSWDEVGTIIPRVTHAGGQIEMTLEMNEVIWPGHALLPPKGTPDKRFFRIVTLYEEPYISYLSPDQSTGQCGTHSVACKLTPKPDNPEQYGNATRDKNGKVEYCCIGLCVDLLKILSEKMNFDYEMYEVPDHEWGIENQKGEWTGLIKEMIEKRADMVMTSIKINHERAKEMEFSTPFLETGITIMVALRKGAISATAFLEPYDCPSWCLILVLSVHATGASIFIFEWLSPSGLNKGRTPLREHKFSLFRSFWLIWAALFGASVTTDNPRGMSSRFMANVWALFALVFLASYTANLAAFMITIDEYYDLSGIQDLRLMNPTAVTPNFKFATIPGGSTEDNLRKNYPKMHKYMQKYNQSTVDNGILALKHGDIQAFIYDATVLEYKTGRDKECDLRTVGKWYAMTGYGVGFPIGSPYKEEVNKIILELQYNGIDIVSRELDRLQKFWLAGACHAKKDKKDKTSHNIGILNFISAFILLAAGVTLATVLLLLEHLYFKFGRRCLKKYDMTGCCSLVSLSMGKSLTFQQTVIDTMDLHKSHRCKDHICETLLWKARHELDFALIKIDRLKMEMASLERELQTDADIEIVSSVKEILPTEHIESSLSQNNHLIYKQQVHASNTDNQSYSNHTGNFEPSDSINAHTFTPHKNVSVAKPTTEINLELLTRDKRRLHFRRTSSYNNAMLVENDNKDNSGYTIITPHTSIDANTKPCHPCIQAFEKPTFIDKQNTKTRLHDGKYYVGVEDDDNSHL